MSLGNPLGLALGSLISPALAHDTSGDGIDKILLLQFGLALAAAIACLFLSSSPPTPPSATAAYRRGNDNLGRDFKSLRNNFGFLTLFQLFSLAVGAFQALLTLMEQILRPSLYTAKDAGSISATIVLCGIVGAGALLLTLSSTYCSSKCKGSSNGLSGGDSFFSFRGVHHHSFLTEVFTTMTNLISTTAPCPDNGGNDMQRYLGHWWTTPGATSLSWPRA